MNAVEHACAAISDAREKTFSHVEQYAPGKSAKLLEDAGAAIGGTKRQFAGTVALVDQAIKHRWLGGSHKKLVTTVVEGLDKVDRLIRVLMAQHSALQAMQEVAPTDRSGMPISDTIENAATLEKHDRRVHLMTKSLSDARTLAQEEGLQGIALQFLHDMASSDPSVHNMLQYLARRIEHVHRIQQGLSREVEQVAFLAMARPPRPPEWREASKAIAMQWEGLMEEAREIRLMLGGVVEAFSQVKAIRENQSYGSSLVTWLDSSTMLLESANGTAALLRKAINTVRKVEPSVADTLGSDPSLN